MITDFASIFCNARLTPKMTDVFPVLRKPKSPEFSLDVCRFAILYTKSPLPKK